MRQPINNSSCIFVAQPINNSSRIFVAQPIKNSSRVSSMRQLINNSSRVPAYQNLEKIVGFCDFLFKPCSNDWKRVWEKVRSPFLCDLVLKWTKSSKGLC